MPPQNIGKFFQSIIENINLGIIVVNEKGNVVYVNPAYEPFIGKSVSELMGKHISEVVDEPGIQNTVITGQAELGVWMKTKGEKFYCHRIPFKHNNQKYAMAVIAIERPDQLNTVLEKLWLMEAHLSFYEKKFGTKIRQDHTFETIIGQSISIEFVKKLALKASKSHSNVLITGETGVGKDVFATAIHNHSKRFGGPFVKVNCAAIPEQLIESEFFGYEKGAFTGAHEKGKIGKFEYANNGTIFLDEIGDLPLSMQPKLLRVLQDGEITRVGGNKPIYVNVRVIAATNKNLEMMVSKNQFRSDLFYRLNVFCLEIPPLRKRKEDIPLFIDKFLKTECDKLGVPLKKMCKNVLNKLKQYSWPGNVRELANVIESLVNYSEGNEITMEDLYLVMGSKLEMTDLYPEEITKLDEILLHIEKRIIMDKINEFDGNKTKAAENLGIHRTTLYEKLRKMGINPNEIV
jgi:transcriptional regulator with PAS, ATPase and Fis domain